MSFWNDEETQALAKNLGAVTLLDKLRLVTELIPAIKAATVTHTFGETYRWFVCPERSCNQRYDMGRGYYVMREGAVKDETNKQPCSECSLRLYLAKRSASLADSVWLCANEECPSNGRERVHLKSLSWE
jgi:hypothetical protein